MRNFRNTCLLLALACLPLGTMAQEAVPAARLVEVGEGYSQTSVNTTVFRNNSLVTSGDEQYIAYYDADGYLMLGKRKLGSDRWTLHRTQYKGNVKDAHNVISMMIDGKGYLHVAFDHHGHPLNYCRSLKPYSLELGEKEPMTGVDEGNVTYPEFYLLSGGDLLFAYRSGSSGRGNLVLNRYDVKTGRWHRVQDVLIDGEDKRNAYWQLYVDEQGTITCRGCGAKRGMWRLITTSVTPVPTTMASPGTRPTDESTICPFVWATPSMPAAFRRIRN